MKKRNRKSCFLCRYTLLDRKDCANRILWSKTIGGVSGAGVDPPHWKTETAHLSHIWLEIYINWHTKRQVTQEKCIHFSRGRIYPAPPSPPVICVVLLHKFRFLQFFLSRSVYESSLFKKYCCYFEKKLLQIRRLFTSGNQFYWLHF